MIYTMDTISQFAADKEAGTRLEVDQDLFEYFLEVLPPAHMLYTARLADGTQQRATFGFAEGAELVTAFWSAAGKHYAQLTREVNPYA